MNILVCGGTRFIGKYLVTELFSNGQMVMIATRWTLAFTQRKYKEKLI